MVILTLPSQTIQFSLSITLSIYCVYVCMCARVCLSLLNSFNHFLFLLPHRAGTLYKNVVITDFKHLWTHYQSRYAHTFNEKKIERITKSEKRAWKTHINKPMNFQLYVLCLALAFLLHFVNLFKAVLVEYCTYSD